MEHLGNFDYFLDLCIVDGHFSIISFQLPAKGVKINLHSSSSLIHKCQNYFPYIYHPLQVFSSSLLMKTSCLRLKLVELNFFVSFNTDDQSKTDVANAINVITNCLTVPTSSQSQRANFKVVH